MNAAALARQQEERERAVAVNKMINSEIALLQKGGVGDDYQPDLDTLVSPAVVPQPSEVDKEVEAAVASILGDVEAYDGTTASANAAQAPYEDGGVYAEEAAEAEEAPYAAEGEEEEEEEVGNCVGFSRCGGTKISGEFGYCF